MLPHEGENMVNTVGASIKLAGSDINPHVLPFSQTPITAFTHWQSHVIRDQSVLEIII